MKLVTVVLTSINRGWEIEEYNLPIRRPRHVAGCDCVNDSKQDVEISKNEKEIKKPSPLWLSNERICGNETVVMGNKKKTVKRTSIEVGGMEAGTQDLKKNRQVTSVSQERGNTTKGSQGFSGDANIRFIGSDIGPFQVTIAPRVGMDPSAIKPLNRFDIGRLLNKSNIKFDEVRSNGRNRWIVNFVNRHEANKALNHPHWKEINFSAFITWHAVHKKVIIRGFPIDVPIEEVLEELKESNEGMIFEDCERMKRRVIIKGISELVDSQSLKITIRSTVFPKYLTL